MDSYINTAVLSAQFQPNLCSVMAPEPLPRPVTICLTWFEVSAIQSQNHCVKSLQISPHTFTMPTQGHCTRSEVGPSPISHYNSKLLSNGISLEAISCFGIKQGLLLSPAMQNGKVWTLNTLRESLKPSKRSDRENNAPSLSRLFQVPVTKSVYLRIDCSSHFHKHLSPCVGSHILFNPVAFTPHLVWAAPDLLEHQGSVVFNWGREHIARWTEITHRSRSFFFSGWH